MLCTIGTFTPCIIFLQFSLFTAERIEKSMKKYIIAFGSVTVAMKAQTALLSNGIKSDVIRTPKNLASGCGYSLAVGADAGKAIDILENKDIKYKAVMEIK